MTWSRSRRPSSEADFSDDSESAYERALRIINGASQSEHVLRLKLKRAGFSPEPVDVAVERLKDIGFVDDLRLATAIAQSKAAKGYNRPLIAAELRKRGMDRTTIDQVLAALSDDDVTIGMMSRVNSSLRGNPDQDDLAKLGRQLQRRGHHPAAIRQALETRLQEPGRSATTMPPPPAPN